MRFPGRSLTIATGKSGGWFFKNGEDFWHLGMGCLGITWWRCDVEALLTHLLFLPTVEWVPFSEGQVGKLLPAHGEWVLVTTDHGVIIAEFVMDTPDKHGPRFFSEERGWEKSVTAWARVPEGYKAS